MLDAGDIDESVGSHQDHGRRSSGAGTDSRSICAGSPTGIDMASRARS